MPVRNMKREALTARNLETLPDGWYTDSGRGSVPTLLFVVSNQGRARSFVQRVTVSGRRRTKGLGALKRTAADGSRVGWLTLSEARDAAMANYALARRGGDPWADEPAPVRTKTAEFGDVVREWMDGRTDWKAGSRTRNESTVRRHVLPALGATPVSRLSRGAVISALKGVGGDADRRAAAIIIEKAYDLAVATGRAQPPNPAEADVLKAVPSLGLKRDASKTVHRASMPYQKVGPFLRSLPEDVYGDAVRFIVATACRLQEGLGARFDEVRPVGGREVWTVPAARTKGRTDHPIPLNGIALAVLERRRRGTDGTGLLFTRPGTGRKLPAGFAQETLSGRGATLHGCRSSFRVFAEERTDARPDTAEACLNHTIGGAVERAYSRSQRLAAKADLFNAWSDFLTG